MSEIKISGPEFFPISGKKPEQIIIMLHGVGADGENLMGLAHELCRTLPEAYFTAPNAPFPYDGGFGGYQWFSLWDRSPMELLAGLENVRPAIQAFIDEKCAQHGLTYKDVALVGFSQGCMTSLHVGPRLPEKIAGIVGFSGTLVQLEPEERDLTAKPPVCLIHGRLDEVVQYKFSSVAYQILKRHNFEVEHHPIDGLGHSIDLTGIKIAGDFLKKIFKLV